MLKFYSILLFTVFSNVSFSQVPTSIYQSTAMDKSLTDGANAVVRLDEMTVEISSRKEMDLSCRRVVTVLNKLGNKHVHANVGYNNSIRIKNIQAVVYDAQGNELNKFKKKEFKDVSAVSSGTLYSDSRILYLDYTPIQYPYTIEFTYGYSTENTANIPSWYFLDGFSVSTEKSRYKIRFSSPELKPDIKEKNLGKIQFEKTSDDNSIVYEAAHIASIKQEMLSPSFNKMAPKLLVRAKHFYYEGYDGDVDGWKDVGLWMYTKILKDRDVLSEATIAKATSLVKDVENPLEKAKIIYKYVQDNTRYISVQVGVGGIQPISALDVDNVKYGDCKGLSNYTRALLEAVNVPAYYTHVQAGSDKVDFEDDFADLSQGNHVILAIPYKDTYYWIDCTSQTLPFGFLGDFTDDRKVLVIKPDGGELVKTPSYINDRNLQNTMAVYSIDENAGITGEVSIDTKGIQYDHHFSLQQESQDDIEKYYKRYWNNINNLKLTAYEFQNHGDKVAFDEKVKVVAEGYGSKNNNRILFAPNAFNKSKFVPDRYRDRKLPFEIPRGFLDEDEFTIHLPEEFDIEALPNEKDIENEFGYYKMSVKPNNEERTISYKRSFYIKKGVYPKDKYDAYRNFRREVSRFDNAKIAIINKNQ